MVENRSDIQASLIEFDSMSGLCSYRIARGSDHRQDSQSDPEVIADLLRAWHSHPLCTKETAPMHLNGYPTDA